MFNCLKIPPSKTVRKLPLFLIQARGSRNRPFIPPVQKHYRPILYFSLEERLGETRKDLKDPELYSKVNIGFQHDVKPKTLGIKKNIQENKKNVDLEKKSRTGMLIVDLDTIEKEWNSTLKPLQVKILAEKYDIFKHLFGSYAIFHPVINMNISYDFGDNEVSPVYFGNLLKPSEAESAPAVSFSSKPDELWSFILTNPDGNIYDNESELVHWFVGNIPGGDISKGDVILDYMRPIPPKGTGFHRFVFVLYKQNGHLDFSSYRRQIPCHSVKERQFKTIDFYKEFEDDVTPAGLAWFQADYDESLIHYYHHILDMKEPVYEYEFPKPYIAPQKFFPANRSFNRYLNLHRDPKEMQKWMLLKRLKNVHPFNGEIPLYPFPQMLPVEKTLPYWEKYEIRCERDGLSKYRDMYRGDDRPVLCEKTIRAFPRDKK